MKKLKLLLLLVFIPSVLFGKKTVEKHVRSKTNFNNDWKFSLENNAGYESPTFDDSQWRLLNLPHDWSIEGAFDANNPAGGNGAFLPAGIGWYRKSFIIPDSLKAKRFVIQFDGIYMNSRVYINGHFLGNYPYGYSTFQYDLTQHLQFDKPKSPGLKTGTFSIQAASAKNNKANDKF